MKQPKEGDRRIMVEVMTNLPIRDGEADWDAAEYKEAGPFPTIQAATAYAGENDINGVGAVIVEVFTCVSRRDGVFEWDAAERWVEGFLNYRYDEDY